MEKRTKIIVGIISAVVVVGIVLAILLSAGVISFTELSVTDIFYKYVRTVEDKGDFDYAVEQMREMKNEGMTDEEILATEEGAEYVSIMVRAYKSRYPNMAEKNALKKYLESVKDKLKIESLRKEVNEALGIMGLTYNIIDRSELIVDEEENFNTMESRLLRGEISEQEYSNYLYSSDGE